MNYQEMSDLEINKLVALKVGGFSFNDEGLPVVNVIDNSPGSYSGGEYEEYEFDPCNSWSDAGPIIQGNGIGLVFEESTSLWKAGDFYPDITSAEWGHYKFNFYDKNPLRAICIVFLMMKGGE